MSVHQYTHSTRYKHGSTTVHEGIVNYNAKMRPFPIAKHAMLFATQVLLKYYSKHVVCIHHDVPALAVGVLGQDDTDAGLGARDDLMVRHLPRQVHVGLHTLQYADAAPGAQGDGADHALPHGRSLAIRRAGCARGGAFAEVLFGEAEAKVGESEVSEGRREGGGGGDS